MKTTAYLLVALTLALALAPYATGQHSQASAPAQKPQAVTFTSIGAEEFIAGCKDVGKDDPPSAAAMVCLSYIAGFTDGYGIAMARFNHEKQSAFCPPQEVTRQQMAKVIVKYGADHPNLLWSGAALFTAIALKDGYPCQE